MKTLWQRILLYTVLLGSILACGGAPVQAESDLQASFRIDAYSIAVEDGEFIYIVGDAVNLSGQLPAGSLDLGGGMLDLWVSKLRRDGTPVFQALIGGKADETAFGVAVRQGIIYILGETWSTDFPQAPGNAGENDAVVLALAADGSQILWARRFGGSDQDSGRAITIRGTDLYLTGITWSQDFLPGGWQGDADGFLAQLDLSGGLQWIKEFGGRNLDAPFGLAAGAGGIWVTGQTFSPNLGGAPLGGGDIFALRFDANGAQQYAGLYGGAGEDVSYAAALAPDGSLYLTGDTQSAGLPGAKGEFGGGTDALLMRIGADGGLQSTSYLGGSGLDSGMALAVLPDGDALVAGGTHSAVFPTGYTLSASSKGGQDAFLAQVNPAGEVVSISLQGGSGDDDARGIGVTSNGIVLVGSFNLGNLPYLLLVPPVDIPKISLPTNAPLPPTATLAATATSQPTETPIPTANAQATGTPLPAATETQLVVSTSIIDLSPTQPIPMGTAPVEIEPATTDTAIVAAGTATPVVPTAPVPLATHTLGPQEQPGDQTTSPGVWVGGGLILAAVLGAIVAWYVRKKKP